MNKPKLVWLVFRDHYPTNSTDTDYRVSHELHSIWSTQSLAKEQLVRLCQRYNLVHNDIMNLTTLFKAHKHYAGYTVEYREVDVL